MKKLIGPKEAATYLGLSINTIYAWISQQKIPYYKVSRLVKFDVEEIDNWLAKRKHDVNKYNV